MLAIRILKTVYMKRKIKLRKLILRKPLHFQAKENYVYLLFRPRTNKGLYIFVALTTEFKILSI
jgi:hypothetical protein